VQIMKLCEQAQVVSTRAILVGSIFVVVIVHTYVGICSLPDAPGM
jgi:hypothetical protein